MERTTPTPAADEPPVGPAQPSLPLDEPVPFAVTARGRRLVAAEALPDLRVVDDPVDLEAPDDTRRVRARALRRAGMDPAAIAEELDADPLHVEAWVDAVPAGTRRRRLRVVEDPGPSAPAPRVDDGWDDAEDEGWREARRRLDADPSLRAGLGLVVGLLRPDRHALLLDAADAALLVAAWSWLATHLGADGAASRLLVRHSPDDAGDRLAHRLATSVGVPVGSVATTRDATVPAGRPALRLRLADPALAARVAGWRRHLLMEVGGHPSLG